MGTNSVQCISITQYHRGMGKICFPNGFEEHLKSMAYDYDEDLLLHNEDGSLRNHTQEARIKSITQQMRCFGWSEFKRPVEWDDPCLVSEKPNYELQSKIHPITMDREHIRLIVKENMVVGVVLEDAVG